MGRKNRCGELCDVLETVWSEPGSPVSERYRKATNNYKNQKMKGQKVVNGHHSEAKANFNGETVWLDVNDLGDPVGGDPDELFLLPDRVLTVDSITFREELASVAPAFLSPMTPTTPSSGLPFGATKHILPNSSEQNKCLPHHSLESDDSNRSSVRLLDDTEGLIITRACKGCLWLCKYPIKIRQIVLPC